MTLKFGKSEEGQLKKGKNCRLTMKKRLIQVISGIFVVAVLLCAIPVLVWNYTNLSDWIIRMFDPNCANCRLEHVLFRHAFLVLDVLLNLCIIYKIYRSRLFLAMGMMLAIVPIVIVVYRFNIYPLTVSGRIHVPSTYFPDVIYKKSGR